MGKKGDHSAAIIVYSQALDKIDGAPENERDRLRLALHNNRSMAYLQQGEPAAAVADASVVLELQPGNAKALFRRALAHKKLGGANIAASVVDLIQLTQLQPSNNAAKQELAACKELALQQGLVKRPQETKATPNQMKSIPIIEDSDDSSDE